MFHLLIYAKKMLRQNHTIDPPLHDGKQLLWPFHTFCYFWLLALHPECITFHNSICLFFCAYQFEYRFWKMMQTSPLQKSSHLHKQNTWNKQGGSTSDLVSQDRRDENPLMWKTNQITENKISRELLYRKWLMSDVVTESRQPSWATAMAVVFLDTGDQSDFNI